MFQTAFLALAHGTDCAVASSEFSLTVSTATEIVDFVAAYLRFHLRKEVRQVIGSARAENSQSAGCVEAEEEDARLVFIANVGAYIQFRKRICPGDGRNGAAAHAGHVKRSYCEPRLA